MSDMLDSFLYDHHLLKFTTLLTISCPSFSFGPLSSSK